MRIITTRSLIREVADRWAFQYPPSVCRGNHPDKFETYKKLLILDKETATPQDLVDIIGNSSWTSLQCDECSQDVEAVIELGEEPGWESRTARICPSCMRKAFQELANYKL